MYIYNSMVVLMNHIPLNPMRSIYIDPYITRGNSQCSKRLKRATSPFTADLVQPGAHEDAIVAPRLTSVHFS